MKEHSRYSGYFITEQGEVYRKPIPRDYSLGIVGDNGFVKLNFFKRGHSKYPEHRYDSVNISIKDENGKFLRQILAYVHVLVAETFVDNPENLKEVDHINRKKDDNRAENLRWINRFDNASEPNHKSYKITDTITGNIWEGYNLVSWVKQNYDFVNTRMIRKDRDIKQIARDLSNARSHNNKIWKLVVEYGEELSQ
jgi:hypothetical protein